ncbi:Heme/hemopexin-binding protein precursor [Stieleria maiorica]|uniref:Heme/hemopexin-binding protein n=1 Tax=Stieleria maiorica TaxID=2795974 RepID=A0A5B9MLR1_9BACT|nr:filamentous hemagglutinin N-terminal domain-containing protein [Stieleria maiorica]QEG01934.1 Heme/hemopexin-binding protein precursor [Stieleria maiorica]
MLFQSIVPPAVVWADGGGTVVAGSATIAQNGTTLNVTSQSDRTIINWQGFSIEAGQTANFLQPSATSAVLNRVVTPNNPSAIYGTLNSNGNVFLVNPSGIVVGASGVINTNGFTASVLDIPDHEFMQGGSLTFRGDSTASVLNRGTIRTDSGGAALIGASVTNEGTITSDGGSISLATGGSVTLADGSRFTHADLATIESGISPYAGVIKNSGNIRATGALEAGGEVYLVNPGGKVMQQGLIAATKTTSDTAAKTVGGNVVVTGDSVELSAATIDASGEHGGGQINIGGGYQGGDPNIINAAETSVDEHSVIRADAYVSGDGGQVIIWSDGKTHFTGTAGARGGVDAGDGGFVEVSGHDVYVAGRVDVGADRGTGGLFLLDPTNACLAFDASSCAPGEGFGDIDTIVATLNGGGSLLVGTAAGGTDAGNIRIVDSIQTNTSGTQTLTIRAHGGISLENGSDIIDSGDGLNLQLLADFDASGGDTISIASGSTIDTNGGWLRMSGADNVIISDSITSGGGAISFLADDYSINATVNAGAGTVLFDRATAGNFGLGFNGGNTATLNAAELGRISAANLVIGDPTAADNQIVQLDVQSTFDLSGTITGLVQLNALNRAGSFVSPSGAQTFRSIEINANDGVTFINDASMTTTVGDAIFNTDADATGVSGGFDDFRAQGGAVNITSAADLIVNAPQYSEVNGGTTSLTAADAITFQRSTSGTIGVGTGSGLTFSDAQLARMNAGTIRFGDPSTTNNTTGIDVADIDLRHVANVEFNTAGTTTFGGTTSFDAVSTHGGTATTVSNAASVDATDTIAFNTTTVNLDGNLTATGGISGNATTVNVISPDAEIQDGIAVAANSGATVTVGDGTYAESVLLNKANVILVGGADAIIAPASPAVTISAAGTTVDGFTYSGTSGSPAILVTSGANNVTLTNGVITGTTGNGDGIRIDNTVTSALAIEISNVTMTAVERDGILFNNSLNGADIAIRGNSILGGRHGVHFDSPITGNTTVIDIANNALIEGASQGIVFSTNVTDATVRIRGNGTDASGGIRAPFDAIAVNGGTLTDATFIVGGDAAADGNFIVSSSQGLDIDAIHGGRFVVANNDLIQGAAAIEFEQSISNGAEIVVVNNGDFSSGGIGIQFRDDIDDAVITIAGNAFANTAGDAIRFNANNLSGLSNRITDANITIGGASNVLIDQTTASFAGNAISGSSNGNGINVAAAVQGDTDFVISDNSIGDNGSRVGQDGVRFSGGLLDTATVSIGGTNQVFATEQAIQVDDLQSASTLAITGGSYDGSDGALLIDNTGVAGSAGRLDIGAASLAGGASSNVVEIMTDTGNAGVDLEITGGATISGGATGMLLSGSGVNILGDSLGSLAFTGQSSSYIALADGAEFSPGSPTVIDATAVTFDGLTGTAMTSAQLIAVEEMLTHFPDDNTLGLIDISPLFVVDGESIQSAINAAGLLAGPQTVTVGSGTFGGSVEVWVDDLTLAGAGAATIIDTDAVDPFANNGDVDNGFQIAAISGSSGGGDVSGVTIDGFSFEALTTSGGNTGIELGAAGSSSAGGTTVINNHFTDLNHGILATDLVDTTLVQDNVLTGGAFGIVADQSAAGAINGQIAIVETSVTGVSDTGLLFRNNTPGNTLHVTLQGVTIHGGSSPTDHGIVFDGSGLSLDGNSLGDTVLLAQNGNYIELRNGGLFDPGRPTLIDATGITFDSFDATTLAGCEAVELKIVHFIDDPTLGLIYPGVQIDLTDELTYDRFTRYDDYFRTIGSLLEPRSGVIRYPANVIVIADPLTEATD